MRVMPAEVWTSRVRTYRGILAALAVLFAASSGRAEEDAFYAVMRADLEITDGKFPGDNADADAQGARSSNQELLRACQPYAVLEGAGEVYLLGEAFVIARHSADLAAWNAANLRRDEAGGEGAAAHLVVRASAGKDVAGSLYVPKPDLTGMVHLKFRIPAAAASDEAHNLFYRTKVQHYWRLQSQNIAGAAWFRHQARVTRGAISNTSPRDREAQSAPRRPDVPDSEWDDTFNLFSGGRAIAENLQLDRVLTPTEAGETTVDVAKIDGITVAEFDWTKRTEKLKPVLDPLARHIPADQHALFVPSLKSLAALVAEFERVGDPVQGSLAPRVEDNRLRERYERQLCLSLDEFTRAVGDPLIQSIAVTGSDPYFPSGTDVAFLFETNQLDALKALIQTSQLASLPLHPGTVRVNGTAGDLEYAGVVSPDRRVSSYLATVGGALVVTNSLAQLERIAQVAKGDAQALAALPEYAFFRDRYVRGEPEESAFLLLTDATIRRWCSPRWRIGASRRTRAVALLSEQQARFTDALAAKSVKPTDIETDWNLPNVGALHLTPAGVRSSTYGSLEFITPIVELDLAKATPNEAEAYKRWRDTYQQYWKQFFDPIALRISTRQDRLFTDISVMPLIGRSDYADYLPLVANAAIKPDAGDRHPGTLFHWSMAINVKSDQARSADNFLENMGRVGVLGWLGQSIGVYADADPFWMELAEAHAANPADGEKFVMQQIHRLPVAFRAEVSNSLKLALFLTGVRGVIEQSAPNLVTWETVKRGELSYVKIAPAPATRDSLEGVDRELALYYAATPTGLTVTLNKDLIGRVLDREGARQAAATPADKPAQDVPAAEKAATGKPADAPVVDKPAAKKAKGKKAARKAATEPAAAEKSTGQPAGTKSVDVPPTVEKGAAPAAELLPWLGSSLALQMDGRVLQMLKPLIRDEYAAQMQARAWSNIPILNEWKRRYPDEDPVKLHQRLWHTRLRSPEGGGYVWNEAWQTMESADYGHPGEPKPGPSLPPLLEHVKSVNFGVTFEDQGLRARMSINRE